MSRETSEALQGTLDLMILKTATLARSMGLALRDVSNK
jgi:hypothetical protein